MSHINLPPELEQRVAALAHVASAEPAKVLERLVDYALGYGEGLAAGADLPAEIACAKVYDLAHGEDAELAGHASALLDGLDADALDFSADELAEEIADADELRGERARKAGRKRLVAYLKAQLQRDYFNDPSA